MNTILNLTQHASTPEQGCFDLTGETLVHLKSMLDFKTLPSRSEIDDVAFAIASLAAVMVEQEAMAGRVVDQAMIGGASFLMAPLEAALKAVGIQPVYAFSVRESVDQTMPDGSVRKTAVFRHLGYV